LRNLHEVTLLHESALTPVDLEITGFVDGKHLVCTNIFIR
jgi:hypothetical protein